MLTGACLFPIVDCGSCRPHDLAKPERAAQPGYDSSAGFVGEARGRIFHIRRWLCYMQPCSGRIDGARAHIPTSFHRSQARVLPLAIGSAILLSDEEGETLPYTCFPYLWCGVGATGEGIFETWGQS